MVYTNIKDISRFDPRGVYLIYIHAASVYTFYLICRMPVNHSVLSFRIGDLCSETRRQLSDSSHTLTHTHTQLEDRSSRYSVLYARRMIAVKCEWFCCHCCIGCFTARCVIKQSSTLYNEHLSRARVLRLFMQWQIENAWENYIVDFMRYFLFFFSN